MSQRESDQKTPVNFEYLDMADRRRSGTTHKVERIDVRADGLLVRSVVDVVDDETEEI